MSTQPEAQTTRTDGQKTMDEWRAWKAASATTFDADSIGTTDRRHEYLSNRLFFAFKAGMEAARKIDAEAAD